MMMTTVTVTVTIITIASNIITPLSLSMDELIYLFKGLLPSIQPPLPTSYVLVDVGSRLGCECYPQHTNLNRILVIISPIHIQ
jgi:hypothetical protein